MASINLQDGEQARLTITKEQEIGISKLYRQVYLDLKKQMEALPLQGKGTTSQSLKKTYLNKLVKQLKEAYQSLGEGLEKQIKKGMQDTASTVVQANDDWLKKVGLKIEGAYSFVPKDIVALLSTGKLYGEGWTLSKAIWGESQKHAHDIDKIVAAGVAANKSAYEIAKDLEKYVNPSVKKEWNWSKVYPGTSKKVDYNAQRLARTMVSHAYQQSLLASTKFNPFVKGYRWRSAHTHRTCEICNERDGQLYSADDLPLDHPNGMCTFIAELTGNMTQIADELADWVQGKPNPGIDKWFKAMYPEIPKKLSIIGSLDGRSGGINLVGGKGNPELTDSINDFYLPPGVRDNLVDYHKLKTYEQLDEFFGSRGIQLDTDLLSLKGDRRNDEIEAVMELGQKIAVAVDSYREVFGKDALSKLKKVVLYSNDEDATASYRYNALGENDPTAGSIHFRDWISGGRVVFHELAHAFQDSHARPNEDAVSYSNRVVVEAKLGKDVKTYTGAGDDVIEAERFADAFANAFVYGDEESIRFLKRVAKLKM